MVGLVSASGLVGFLAEPDTELQIFALRTANDSMSLMWTEFAGAVGQMYVSSPFLISSRWKITLIS